MTNLVIQNGLINGREQNFETITFAEKGYYEQAIRSYRVREQNTREDRAGVNKYIGQAIEKLKASEVGFGSRDTRIDGRTEEAVGGTVNPTDNGRQGSNEGTSNPNIQQPTLGSDNRSNDTQKFFSETVKGDNSPKRSWKPLYTLSNKLQKVYDTWKRFSKGFSNHIETSIPSFRETQFKKIEAIANNPLNKWVKNVIDLGGSQGDFGKTISSLNPNIHTVNVDMNQDMIDAHNSTPVNNAAVLDQRSEKF